MTKQNQATKYQVFDTETENYETFKRFANPFDPKNYIVAIGWKVQGDSTNSWSYHKKGDKPRLPIGKDIGLLVGLNIKFDLLYCYNHDDLRAFLDRGGQIWDCQYVEYLLSGADPKYHMVSMDSIIEYYGGRKKIDEVKALWDMGVKTSEIDKDLLIDYLVGTEEESRASGDIGNTELIFLGQVARVMEQGMLPMVQARMDGLLATTEMEFNGLHIDTKEAKRKTIELTTELDELNEKLNESLPELPEGLNFNWASNVHLSCLLFGGTIKYKKSAPYLDQDGNPARKKEIRKVQVGIHTSGRWKGEPKYKTEECKGELKYKMQEFYFELPGFCKPKPEWRLKLTDGADGPVFKTDADVVEALGSDIPFIATLQRRNKVSKDLSTYYLIQDDDGELHGMLTCMMPDHLIHHSLHHVLTTTTRLSSSKPNCQNIPKESTSEVKKMFNSRWEDGVMLEADYSQLEVVVQGLLSGDRQLIEDLNNKVDFHCKRVAAWKGCTYEEAVYRCKDESYPDHRTWRRFRTDAKVFSFQRAYGAGAEKISATTGMPIEDVKALIEAEEILYSGVVSYNDRVKSEVENSAYYFKDPVRGFRPFRQGYYKAPTGTLYSFRSYDAPSWAKKKGINDTFMPTELKNYPVQGTGGEIVQMQLGCLYRHFRKMNNYGGKALLVNTVHDCVWIDCKKEVSQEVAKDVKRILESVPEELKKRFNIDCKVPFPVEVEIGENLYNKKVIHI